MTQSIEIKLSADELEGTEATISQWLFNVGEQIQKGEPIVELETDKVSMEICTPDTGILKEILVQAGEKVETDTLLAVLSGIEILTDSSDQQPAIETKSEAVQLEQNTQTDTAFAKNAKHLLSPAVRRLLKENNLDINEIKGTGKNGRVNRHDVKLYLSASNSSTLVPHSNIRRTIADHMVDSLLKTSPHVTSVFEMDMSRIIAHRQQHKQQYADDDVKLTYTAYFLAAIVKAVQHSPEVNARFHEHALEIFNDINIGVGTALGDKGLVVPVVKMVQNLSLLEIARALTIQTTKARDGNLKPADMKNGTFTISNYGTSGSLFAAPIIINQPQVAILGIGKLQKRAVVREIDHQDSIQIKAMCYVSLTIDHRALDAYQTSEFLSVFVDTIENWD